MKVKKIEQKRKPEKSKIQKDTPKSIQFKNNEIYSLKDIVTCVSSLSISNCPIFSLKGLNNFDLVKTFNLKNALIYSFKDISIIKKVENISFEGCPISRYPHYRLMVLLLFCATNDIKLKKIDSVEVTDEEKAIVKNCLNEFSHDSSESSLIQSYLKNGGIIRTIDDLSPKVIRRKTAPSFSPPNCISSKTLPSLTFSPFLTPKAIQEKVNAKSEQLATTSSEKKICDYQNELRSFQLEFDDIFVNYDLLNSNSPISPLFQHIQNIHIKVNNSIQKISNIELSREISQDLESSHNFLKSIESIIKIYQNIEENLKNYLTKEKENFKEAQNILTNSKISNFCQDYIDNLNQIIVIIENILNPQNFSIDHAVSNIAKISEIKVSFISPYHKIFNKILDLTKSLLNKFNDRSVQTQISCLYQKVSFYRKRPLLSHFDQILEQIALIQSCLSVTQNDEKFNILIEISNLCQNSMDEKVFNIYMNIISTNEIIKNIEDSRKSFAISAISFRKNTNYAYAYPKTQNLNESSYVRSKDLEQYIINFKKHINDNQVISSYIKDRIFDCSNDKAHNVYASSMLKLKIEEIEQKNKQIEKLKELIASKKSG